MKEKYVIVFIIGIVSLLLVGTIGFMNAQEEQEIPTDVGDTWLDRIISSINYFFHKQDMFTIYGRELSCSIYPDRVVNFVKDEKYYFSTENICGSDDFFVNYFRGEGGYDQYLKEIYYRQDTNSAYVTDGDGQGNIYLNSYVVCDAGAYWDNKCYVEIYCCDEGVCERDSDCDSDEECDKQTSAISDIFPSFGVCEQEEVTYHETKVYECSDGSKDYIGEVSRGDINWCPDPDENNYILVEVGGTSGVCYEEENAPMHCTTPPKTCWRIQDNQCNSISIYTTSCENSGYYSSKSDCEVDVGITRECWKYIDTYGECRQTSYITTKSCEEIGEYITEQACKDAYGLVDDEDEVPEGEEPVCRSNQETFFTNAVGKVELKTWLISIREEITPQIIDSYIAGFSGKYFEEKIDACCENLTYIWEDSKEKEITPISVLFGIIGSRKLTFSYDVYKCVPEGEAGFCLKVAHQLLNPLLHTDNCQTNTIILTALIIGLFLIISRFAGIYGEIKYEI